VGARIKSAVSVYLFAFVSRVTPAHSKTLWEYDLFHTASAIVGNSVIKTLPGKTLHRERSSLATTRGASLNLIARKQHTQEKYTEKRALERTPPFCGWMVGV
tara:strand:- start:2185 stop:2490 length:306 start_codon:yes stop_codon:yes gene_type:complete